MNDTAERHTTNGTTVALAPPPAPAGPRLPKRTAWVDLPPDEYPGFRVRLWVNFPNRLMQEVGDAAKENDVDRGFGALGQIVLEHNGWCDEDGLPYPPTTERAFWEAIPNELAAVLIVLVRQESQRLPNSLAARS